MYTPDERWLALGAQRSVAYANVPPGAYTFRVFPSVSWDGDVPPVGTPREISLSSWSVATGVQFGVGGG